jgi:hypothetical protein
MKADDMKKYAAPSRECHRYEHFWGLGADIAQLRPKGMKPLRRTRNLTTREFDTILRIKFLEFSAEASRKQTFHFRAENAGENKQFEVGNTPLLVFKACHRSPACIPALQLQFNRELILGPPFLPAQLSHLGTDNVQLCRLFFNACTLAAGAHNNVGFT